MRYVRALLVFTLLVAAAMAWPIAAVPRQTDRAGSPGARDIRLVLLVTIDQFRFDYLARFNADYTGGLRRLQTDGAVFVNANLEHYPTVTAIGHTTPVTGAMPATSGIVGNDWFDRETATQVTSVSDGSVQQLGGSGGTGASPHRLLVSTISDEIKMAALTAGADGPTPRAVGVSLKDRGAILPVGRMADAAYWYDASRGAFVSSSYYFEALPDWVQRFNATNSSHAYMGKQWPFLIGKTAHTLPAAPGEPLYSAVYSSPFGNELLTRFAEQVLEEERLGQRGSVDVLAISYSSNDAVGHTYGPHSAEVRAVSLEVDRTIGRLFTTVDRLVGLDRVLVVLTSDHGVAPVPEVLAANRMPGGRLAQEALFGPIQAALEAKFGKGKWILSTAGTSPYLNYALMREREVDPAAARAVAAEAAARLPRVSRVYTRDQLLDGNVPSDTLTRRVLHSHHPRRSGDLEILLDPYWIRSKTGTTHGTPYVYDTHVPLIFMGPTIRAGRYGQPVAQNDVAPTLSTLLRVGVPSGSVGRVLVEMFEDASLAEGLNEHAVEP